METRKSVHSYFDNDSDFLCEMNRMHKVHYEITVDVLQAHAVDHAERRQSRQPRGQSQAEDGWGVQGVIRLVPAAAAAAVGDPAGLVGVMLRGAALLG